MHGAIVSLRAKQSLTSSEDQGPITSKEHGENVVKPQNSINPLLY